MRLVPQRHILALVAVLGLGCESILGLGETSISRPNPDTDAEAGDSGQAGSARGNDGGASGHDGHAASSAGTPSGATASGGTAWETTTGAKSSAGASTGGTATGAATAGVGGAGGDATAGDTGLDDSSAGAAGAVDVSPPALVLATLQSISDGRCLGVAPEAEAVEGAPPVVLRDCTDNDPFVRWQRDGLGRLSCSAAGAYLQVANSDQDRGAVSIGLMTTNTLFQRWMFENVHVVNVGGYCIEMPSGDFSSNQRATLARCQLGPAQAWTLDDSGEIQHGRQCLDIFDGLALDGQVVQTYECQDSPNQRFLFEKMHLQFGEKCIGAVGTVPTVEGAELELQTCLSETDANIGRQQFYMEGTVEILAKCLQAGPGGDLRVAPCDNSESQVWRWSP